MKHNLISINDYNKELRCELYYFCLIKCKCKYPFKYCSLDLTLEQISNLNNKVWAVKHLQSDNIENSIIAKYIIENN
jgi:hypothetical protein